MRFPQQLDYELRTDKLDYGSDFIYQDWYDYNQQLTN